VHRRIPHRSARGALTALATACSLTLLAGCAHFSDDSGDTARTTTPPPAGDNFYAPPAPLPDGAPGDVIWKRALTNDAALPAAGANWLVLYRSTDIDGEPIAVSGTVAVPEGTPPEGGWPVISWTHGTTGIADICAPSKNAPDYPARAYVSLMNEGLNEWVRQGYAVVKTDYQGLGTPGPHPYLIGEVEARGAVDMVRAARRVDPNLSRDWLAMGHSQGGQAAVYASYLGPLYAPELNLTGAVAISPASHLGEQVRYAQTHPDTPSSAYGALMLNSAAAMSPQVKLDEILTPLGQERTALTEDLCVGQLAGEDGFKGLTSKDVMNLDADFTAFNQVFDTLGDSENVRPAVPLLVLQADNDRVVLKQFTDAMVTRFKNVGANVDYRLYTIGGDATVSNHQATVPDSRADAMDWVRDRFMPVR